MNDDSYDNETLIGTRQQWLDAVAPREELGHYLVVIEDDAVVASYRLGSDPLTVGRDAARDVVLVDTQVSRLHLQVSVSQDTVIAEDLGSSNGTFLDGQRLSGPVTLADGRWLQVGSRKLKYQRRSIREAESGESLRRDLDNARNYVQSLMPPPVKTGAVQTDWVYRPSTQLGGDAFSYGRLDDDHVVAYLLDVCGHGVHAAMHSVSVLNVLRQRALPATDFLDPGSVLASLNAMFPMEAHDGMYFTIWYGVYSTRERSLSFASAGHHPGYLFPPGASSVALKTVGPMIGAISDYAYPSATIEVPAQSALYLFSDGVFEITMPDGKVGSLEEFVAQLEGSAAEPTGEAERIYQAVRARARNGALDDDFTLLVARFH